MRNLGESIGHLNEVMNATFDIQYETALYTLTFPSLRRLVENLDRFGNLDIGTHRYLGN